MMDIDKMLNEISKIKEIHITDQDLTNKGIMSLCDALFFGLRTAVDAALEIVHNYIENGGWIPCNDKLPDECESVLVWYEYYRYGSYNRMYQTYGIGWHIKGEWMGDVQGTKARCIAWQPLPIEYYRQKYVGGDYKRQIMERFCRVE